MLEKLAAAHAAGKLQFFGEHRRLGDVDAFAACLAPLRTTRWFVYSKRPFAGPQAVLAYLARYTHRVAIIEPPRWSPSTRTPSRSATRTTAGTGGSDTGP